MDRNTSKILAQEAEAALKAVAEKHGLAVKAAGGTFGATNVVLKFEFAEIGEGGLVQDRTASDFRTLAHLYGLKPEDLGRSFTYGGKPYQITGLKPGGKNPILATSGGKTYKFPADAVRALLASPKKEG